MADFKISPAILQPRELRPFAVTLTVAGRTPRKKINMNSKNILVAALAPAFLFASANGQKPMTRPYVHILPAPRENTLPRPRLIHPLLELGPNAPEYHPTWPLLKREQLNQPLGRLIWQFGKKSLPQHHRP